MERLRPILGCTIVLALLAVASPQYPAFMPFGTWVAECTSESACAAPTAATLEYMAAKATGKATQVSASSACSSACSSSILSALSGTLAQAQNESSSCLMFGNSTRFASFLTATQAFSCPASSNGNADCMGQVTALLRAVGLPTSLTSLMQPGLKYTGTTLSATCQALVPAAGCCLRSWALLLSALARQLCAEALALEYYYLPSRCEIEANTSVVAACDPAWQSSLEPLLNTPPLGSCSTAEQQQGQAWLNGSSCSIAQQQMQGCFSNACDVWCAYLPALNTFVTGNYTQYLPPSPLPLPPPPPPLPQPQPTTDDSSFNQSVKAFVIAFSVIVFVCILAFIVWLYFFLRERQSQGKGKQHLQPATAAHVEEPATPRYVAGPATAGTAAPVAAARAGAGSVALTSTHVQRPGAAEAAPAGSAAGAAARGGAQSAGAAEPSAVAAAGSFTSAQSEQYGSARESSRRTPSFVSAQERFSQTSGGGGGGGGGGGWFGFWGRRG